jgi:hypothetical protein
MMPWRRLSWKRGDVHEVIPAGTRVVWTDHHDVNHYGIALEDITRTTPQEQVPVQVKENFGGEWTTSSSNVRREAP